MRYNTPPKDEFESVMCEEMRKHVANAYLENKRKMALACNANTTAGVIELYRRLYDISEYERIKILMQDLDTAFTHALCHNLA